MPITKKNYSFYMPEDFSEKLEKIQLSNDQLKSLSKSQALYVIVSSLNAENADLLKSDLSNLQ